MLDIIDIKQAVKSNELIAYVSNGYIILKDTKTGEAVIIGYAKRYERSDE